jgi:hypothetical protein
MALCPVLCLLLLRLRKSPPQEDLLLLWRVNLWLFATLGLWGRLVGLLSLFHLRLPRTLLRFAATQRMLVTYRTNAAMRPTINTATSLDVAEVV